MSDIIKTGGKDIVSLLHGKNGELAVPRPFEREIFLFDTYVAGTTHVTGIEDMAPYLAEGDWLEFFREPDNPYDPQAIVVKNADGVKIGYVPKSDNAVFSRLMDAGKLLFGKITSKEMKGKWLKLEMGIYLKD